MRQLFGIGPPNVQAPPPPPQCTDRKINHVHVTYMRERAKRASASDTYRPIFSGLKIHLHTYTINAVPFYYLWYGAINDSIGQNTNIEGKYVNMRASELRFFFAFSHSKTAISFNILILYLRNIYFFRSQMTSAYKHTVNAVPCYYLWYGVTYK